MDEREFKSIISGEVRSHYGEYVYFHPNDLPFDLNISDDIVKKYRVATIILSRLDGKASEMNPSEREVFLKAFTLKESASSSSIEGTRSSFDDMYRYEKEEPATERNLRDSQEVLNYKKALEFGMKEISSGKKIDVELLHEMHKILMKGVRGENKSPGEFKSSQNAIGRISDTVETAKMVPSAPEEVDHLIENLLDFMDSDEEPIIKIALTHYQFETIHPYRDGNGRMGRLLILLMLSKEDILHHPMIYPSEYFDRRRTEYIEKLYNVSSKDEFEQWFDFFVSALIDQSNDSIRTMDSLKAYRRILLGMADTQAERDVIGLLFSNPYIRSTDVMKLCNVTNPTATKVLGSLVAKGIIREITGKKRNMLFSADGVIEILSHR